MKGATVVGCASEAQASAAELDFEASARGPSQGTRVDPMADRPDRSLAGKILGAQVAADPQSQTQRRWKNAHEFSRLAPGRRRRRPSQAQLWSWPDPPEGQQLADHHRRCTSRLCAPTASSSSGLGAPMNFEDTPGAPPERRRTRGGELPVCDIRRLRRGGQDAGRLSRAGLGGN